MIHKVMQVKASYTSGKKDEIKKKKILIFYLNLEGGGG